MFDGCCRILAQNLTGFSFQVRHHRCVKRKVIYKYTGYFTIFGHNCRRWFPTSLWWKKFI